MALCVLGAFVGQSEAVRAEWITRFADPWHPGRTDLSGDFGPINGEQTTLTRTEAGTLRVEARFPRAPEGYGGLWMTLRGPQQSAHVTLDLARWRGIRFAVRGRVLAPEEAAGEAEAVTVRAELKDGARTWERTVYHTFAIAPAEEWSEVILPADLADRSFWRTEGPGPDAHRMKELVLLLEAKTNPRGAALELDDFALVSDGAAEASLSDDRILDEAAEGAFRFLWDYAHPELGLVADCSTNPDAYSAAGTGFGLAAWCEGAERGWVARSEAAERTRRLLRFLVDAPSGPQSEGVTSYRGFFYHFVGRDGRRLGGCELSTVDTALLLWGALCCAGYYDRPEEADIRALAARLVEAPDWRWMLADNGLIRHGWRPEDGGRFLDATWDVYTDETLLVTLLAAGARGGAAVPRDVLWRWLRVPVTSPAGESFVATYPGALFTYLFASCFLPPRALDRLDAHPTLPVNWWANTASAVRSDAAYCHAHPEVFGEDAWGLSACAGVADGCLVYHAYGAPPVLEFRDGRLVQRDAPHWIGVPGPDGNTRWVDDTSVVAPYAAGGALCFAPEEALRALRAYRERYDLWRGADCGFADCFAPQGDYVGRAGFSIDAGPMLLGIANYRAVRGGGESAVWRAVMATPEARRAVALLHGGAP